MMDETYVEVTLSVPADDALRETISFQLQQLGFTGFLENDDSVQCYIQKQNWNDSLHAKLLTMWNGNQSFPVTISHIVEIQHQNWNRQWEESIQPIEVTEKITITPSWHPLPEIAGKICLVIDPKMSFGTGYHESTRLMLRMMEGYVKQHSFILDVGTGTGVLAIGAVKLGARRAIGVDTDEWAYTNAEENVQRNGCTPQVDIRLGSLGAVNENAFDMILANMTRETIIELLPSFVEKINRQGMLLLSGLLVSDREIIENALRLNHLTFLSASQENEWIGIAAQRN